MSEPTKQEEALINSVSLNIGEGLSAKVSMTLEVPITLTKEEIETATKNKEEVTDFGKVKFSRETSALVHTVALAISRDLIKNVNEVCSSKEN